MKFKGRTLVRHILNLIKSISINILFVVLTICNKLL